MVDSSLAMMVCGAGITFFLIHSERGRPFRRLLFKIEYFERMFACSFCTGYWVGILVAVFYASTAWVYTDILGVVVVWANIIMLGMGTGIMSILIDRLIDLGDAAVHSAAMVQSNMPDEVHYFDNISGDEETTNETIYPGQE